MPKKRFRVTIEGEVFEVEILEEEKPLAIEKRETEKPRKTLKNYIITPMAGKIVSIKKKVGDKVSKGEVIAVIESMKTLVEVKSDKDGVVEEVLVKEGDFINFNKPIVKIKPL